MKKDEKKAPAPRRRRRAKKQGRQYFTQVHEDAIVEYSNTEDIKRRSELYIQYIGPVFDEMVDKIVYTYKFTTLPNIDVLRDECKIWLVTVLDKYDPSKGSKAFSYFSVITKNWFIHQVKKRSKQQRTELNIEAIPVEIQLKYVATYNPYSKEREIREFASRFKDEIDSWEHPNMKPNEEKVLSAVKILFENSENIEIFNKKAIYLYLREITGLNTKQVVNNLNKMKIKYNLFRRKWDQGES